MGGGLFLSVIKTSSDSWDQAMLTTFPDGSDVLHSGSRAKPANTAILALCVLGSGKSLLLRIRLEKCYHEDYANKNKYFYQEKLCKICY